ncbi:hypothetical protein OROHE_026376 [Orobanche hederae]
MGEKDEKKKEVVLKLELHCEGCAKKVRRSISNLEGVEKVKTKCKAKKLNVTGNVDPTYLREVVETKTKKKVELISPPPPKKDGGSGGAAAPAVEEKSHQKKIKENKLADDDNNKKPKEGAVVSSHVVMKTKLHCEDCANKIKRIILKNFEGVGSVTTDLHKDLIMVTGSPEPEKLVTYLRERLKRGVDIITIPPAAGDTKKDKVVGDDGGGDKNNGGDQKTKEAAKLVEAVVYKMEHHSNYNNNSQTHYAMPMHMPMPMPMAMPMYNQSYSNDEHHHGMVMGHDSNRGNYMHAYVHGPPAPPPPTYLNMESSSDHMFSDENPNGCTLM